MPTLRLLPELEDSLRMLPGVSAVSVVTTAEATPTEVHVLATREKAAKQLVRDVQSMAMARHQLDLDHRIVSVVQIDDVEASHDLAVHVAETELAAVNHRPAIATVAVTVAGPDADVTVTLRFGDRMFVGSSGGSAGVSARPRLVAQATVNAVQDLLGLQCDVETALLVPTGQRSVALTVLSLSLPRLGELLVTGSAAVRGDEADALARSVLDALNRRLSG
jgi:hypothetical protein